MADYLNYNSGAVVTYFSRLDAAPQGTRRQLTEITALGVDGVAYRKEALRPPEFEGESIVYVANFATADALRIVYEALIARLVLLNHQGLNYQNIIVLDVKVEQYRIVPKAFYVILPDGTTDSGTNAVEVRARWLFRYAGAPS